MHISCFTRESVLRRAAPNILNIEKFNQTYVHDLQCDFPFNLQTIFCNSPIKSTQLTENTPVYRVLVPYESNDNVEQTVTSMIDDWLAIAKLYQIVHQFAQVYNGEHSKCTDRPIITVKWKNL